MEFFVTPETPIVTRVPYGILELFGDIGGLFEFITACIGAFTFMFPAHMISGILA
jgi:hypothetical protein